MKCEHKRLHVYPTFDYQEINWCIDCGAIKHGISDYWHAPILNQSPKSRKNPTRSTQTPPSTASAQEDKQ